MNTVLRIAKWTQTFETAESKRHKTLTWVSLPVKLNSHGYQSLLEHFGDDAAAMYGAWCALLAVAAEAPIRGVLSSSGGIQISTARISRMTGMPAALFDRLIEWAVRDDVRWLERVDHAELVAGKDVGACPGVAQESPSHCPAVAQANPGLPNPTQPNLTQPAAAACAAAAADDRLFAGLPLGEVVEHAKRLGGAIPKHHRPTCDRDFVWQVCCVATALDPTLPAEAVQRIKHGDVKNPRQYLGAMMRDECKKRSLDFDLVRKHCPPTPPPEAPQRESPPRDEPQLQERAASIPSVRFRRPREAASA